MILGQLTFNSFGYRSTDLAPQSGKKIIVACNYCGQLSIMTKQNHTNREYPDLCNSCAKKASFKSNQHGGRVNIEKELLLALHWGNDYKISKVAKIFNCDVVTVYRRMKESDITLNGNLNKGNEPWNKNKIGVQIAWNKNTKGIMKPNSTSFKKGNIPWNKEKSGYLSDESRKNISAGRKGIPSWSAGLTHLDDDRIPYGDKHWNWNDGSSLKLYGLRLSIRHLESKWRNDIFERDDYTCWICGDRSRDGLGHSVHLEAHHLMPFVELIEIYNINTVEDAYNCSLLWDTSNGITVCNQCHKEMHRK